MLNFREGKNKSIGWECTKERGKNRSAALKENYGKGSMKKGSL